MTSPQRFSFTLVLTLFVSSFTFIPAFSAPSAKDIFAACEKQTKLNCNTQHLLYQTTMVLGHGSKPVTNIQTIEMFKKKPNLMKTITDTGVTKQTVIVKNNYFYVLDNKNKTYNPIKAPIKMSDPFQEIQTDLSNFDSATLAVDGTNYIITLRGGKIPNMKAVDRLEVIVDSTSNLITEVKGIGIKGGIVLDVTMQYKKIGSVYQVKTMQTQTNAGAYSITADMKVLKNEIDSSIDDSVFATQ